VSELDIKKTYLAIEELLAAAVDYNGGRLEISTESLQRSFAGKALAIDYDMQKDMIVVTLVDKEDVIYEDE
jgi:hypothetical protein